MTEAEARAAKTGAAMVLHSPSQSMVPGPALNSLMTAQPRNRWRGSLLGECIFWWFLGLRFGESKPEETSGQAHKEEGFRCQKAEPEQW
jgi:hypothetical protein